MLIADSTERDIPAMVLYFHFVDKLAAKILEI